MKKTDCIQCSVKFEKPEGYKLGNICSFKCRDERYYTKEKKAENAKKYRKYKTYNCIVCSKECKAIDDYRSRDAKYNKTCKSEECKTQNQRNIDNKINEKDRDKLHILEIDTYKNNTESTFFSENNHLYQDKLIDYPGSPTGKAYIGLAKRPLMPNDNGIGYKGVLLQSENRNLVQCSITGKWYKIIPAKHLEAHGYTREQYREEFGLNKTQALVSDTYSRFYSSNMINVVSDRINNVSQEEREKWLKKGREVMQKNRKEKYNTDKMKNDKGTCDLQLKHRFIEYIIGHHRYPPAKKFPYPSLKDRFGSINNALKDYGLPTRKQLGYTVLYEFEDRYTFKILKGKGYEELYDIMKLKCPILDFIN